MDTGAVVEHDSGAGAIIIEKVKIGENIPIAAGSSVRKDVGPNVVVAGNTARLVRKRDSNETYLSENR